MRAKFLGPATLLASSIILVSAWSAPLFAQQTEATLPPGTDYIDSIVAVVEQDVILRSELDLAIQGIRERIRAQGGAMPPDDLLERQVLERLIVRKLQVANAARTGIRVSDQEVDQAMIRVAQQNGISLSEMRSVIESGGEDFGEFRNNIEEDMMTDRLMQRIVGGMTPVSDVEIDILLASQDYSGGEYDLSHIMINVPDGSTPDQVRAGADRISEIYEQLIGGADFAATAISYSEAQEALEGGRVGWRDLNSIPAAFADAVRPLERGQISQPIRSPGGFHILKVNDIRQAQAVMIQEYNARHIMIEPSQVLDSQQTLDRIMDIRRRLGEGENFGDLAREYSDDETSANLGGEMGWFPPESYGPQVQQTLEALDEGEISEPFQTPAGWHILQLVGVRETDMTDEAIRETARQTIHQRKADEELERFMRTIRDEAYVEIRLPGEEATPGP